MRAPCNQRGSLQSWGAEAPASITSPQSLKMKPLLAESCGGPNRIPLCFSLRRGEDKSGRARRAGNQKEAVHSNAGTVWLRGRAAWCARYHRVLPLLLPRIWSPKTRHVVAVQARLFVKVMTGDRQIFIPVFFPLPCNVHNRPAPVEHARLKLGRIWFRFI